MTGKGPIAEQYPSKVGAVFASRTAAQQVQDELLAAGFASEQVHFIAPGDRRLGRKVEPESSGIAGTLARTHVRFGLLGGLVGLLAASAGVWSGQTLLSASPIYAFFVLTFLGAIAGLLLAGLVSLRPDHDPLALMAQRAARTGRWTVIVHVGAGSEQRYARDIFMAASADPVVTL